MVWRLIESTNENSVVLHAVYLGSIALWTAVGTGYSAIKLPCVNLTRRVTPRLMVCLCRQPVFTDITESRPSIGTRLGDLRIPLILMNPQYMSARNRMDSAHRTEADNTSAEFNGTFSSVSSSTSSSAIVKGGVNECSYRLTATDRLASCE